MHEIDNAALVAWLKKKNLAYYSKAMNLRETIERWLGYVVNTFPHYTSHAVDHSDTIIWRMSSLLFKEKSPTKAVVKLSAIEAYILIAAAYLHDAGMVVPDDEKTKILASAEWNTWISGPMQAAWNSIEKLRTSSSADTQTVRNFLADLHTRHLIAEFVRREHHIRVRRVMIEQREALFEFSFHDPYVERAIAAVCAGHGLSHDDLQDRTEYPHIREIRNEDANIRWMAIMLRLGDLLDMRFDRACPLLRNAASPLPADSIAHWGQYQAIMHTAFSPQRIEIGAECAKRDQYKTLRNWCKWIAEEVRHAPSLMSHAERHQKWTPPIAAVDREDSIMIKRAPDADFFVDEWNFELDRDAVFERLIKDVYDNDLAFVRELLQNAFDATRVQLYLDLEAQKLPAPEYPNEADDAIRKQYPIEVSLETRPHKTAYGESERQFLTIVDRGVGMDREIISRYLLQIGRSYYKSEAFLKKFHFVPTSRFGVGFLSSFNASDHIVIETYKPTSEAKDGPVRVELENVRSLLLPQKSARAERGTKIELMLRTAVKPYALLNAIVAWCRFVEFPVIVNAPPNAAEEIIAEKPSDFAFSVKGSKDEGTYRLSHHLVREGGFSATIYHVVREHDGFEWWDTIWEYYRRAHVFKELPEFPDNVSCLHGVLTRGLKNFGDSYSWRADDRRLDAKVSLSRVDAHQQTPKEVRSAWRILVERHLELLAPDRIEWKYRQRMAYDGRLDLKGVEALIPIRRAEIVEYLSIDAVHRSPTFITEHRVALSLPIAPFDNSAAFIAAADMDAFELSVRAALLKDRQPISVTPAESSLRIAWGEATTTVREPLLPFYVDIPVDEIAFFSIPGALIVNRRHALFALFQKIEKLPEDERVRLLEAFEYTFTNVGSGDQTRYDELRATRPDLDAPPLKFLDEIAISVPNSTEVDSALT